MTKSPVVAAAFVVMTIASPTFAADLLKAPAAVPVVPDWTGWYIGAEVGGKWVKNDWTTDCLRGDSPLFACGTARAATAFPGDANRSHTFDTSGVRAGGYLGAMFQVNPSWVVGIEGDYAYYNESSDVAGIVGCSTGACRGFPPARLNAAIDKTSVKDRDDFGLRLRVGFLLTPDIMVFATGGGAAQRIEATLNCGGVNAALQVSPACTSFVQSQSLSQWRPGWTAGGGVEWKLAQLGLPNWLLRGEYRYADFGTWSPTFLTGSSGPQVLSSVKVTSQIATAGLAYKFPISK